MAYTATTTTTTTTNTMTTMCLEVPYLLRPKARQLQYKNGSRYPENDVAVPVSEAFHLHGPYEYLLTGITPLQPVA